MSEKDNGQTNAINKGLRKCTGDIIAYINSDDIYLPGMFGFVENYFNYNPVIGMVYGDCKMINEEKRKQLEFLNNIL